MEWDFVIAGGGTAGCVLARRLADRPHTRVLLLEAGPPYNRLKLGIPLPGLRQKEAHSWKYFTAQQSGLGFRRLSMPMGRVMGGSSSVNAMLYFRGLAADYDSWAAAGNQGWSFAEIRPFFERAERCTGGPFSVSESRHRAPFSETFVESCLQMGIPACLDFNAPNPEGAGYFPVSQRRGKRVSTASAYLSPAPAALTVLCGAHIHRLHFEGTRAVGVEYSRAGETHTARAGEIILTAGSLGSPQILMRSGVGPPSHLREMGIPVSFELPGVGAHLQDHVRVPVIYESHRVSPGAMTKWIPAALQYVLARRGVMASNCCECGALVRSSESEVAPDLQFVTHFQSSIYPQAVDLQFCVNAIDSHGRLTLGGAGPDAPPSINPNYLIDSRDMQRAIEGVMLARRIADQPAMRRFGLGRELLPGADLRHPSEIERYVRATAETCYHPVGTCAMGHGPDAVVDPQLRVHGLQGLRVADASVMPQIVRGNTTAAVLMIAEKAASLLGG